MPFPRRPDGLLDFNAYLALSLDEKKRIIDEGNKTIDQVKRAFGLSHEPSGRQLFKASAGYHAVFRHNGIGQVNIEHFEALAPEPKQLLFNNLSDDEKDRLRNALRN